MPDLQENHADAFRREKIYALKLDRRYDPLVKQLMRPEGAIFTCWLLLHGAVWLLGAAAVFAFDPLWLDLVFCIAISNQLHAFTVLQHECGHGNAYRAAWLNTWVGRLLAWFIAMPFTAFTECHKRHHRYLADPERDPDEWNYAGGLKWLPWRIALFVPKFTCLSLVRYGSKIRNTVIFELIFNLSTALLVFYLFLVNGHLQEFIWIFTLPMLILAVVINPLSRGYEHFPMAFYPRGDIRRLDLSKNTITVTGRLIGLLWANINYHVEHHIYPGVPFFRLPMLCELLANKPYIRHKRLLEQLYFRCETSPQGRQYS